jgi:ketosteroid isomerase-like protein
MKQFLAVSALVISMVGLVVAQQPAKATGGSVTQTLLDLENQWGKASKAGDGDAIGALLSNDFVAIDSDGSVRTKADVVARTKKAKWTTNEISDMKVVVHGDAAIVTGTWTGNGTDGTGKAVNAKERWGDTWVKGADGKWLCVASIAAPMK